MVSYIAAFLNKKFLQYQQETGTRQTLKSFAVYLEVKPTTLSNWLNTSSIPNYEACVNISSKLGPEVFDVCGYRRPDSYIVEEFSSVPGVLRERVFDAFREIDKTLSGQPIDLSPEERTRVADNIMTKYGFTRTDKTKPGKDG
jgi:hypothetical protein